MKKRYFFKKVDFFHVNWKKLTYYLQKQIFKFNVHIYLS